MKFEVKELSVSATYKNLRKNMKDFRNGKIEVSVGFSDLNQQKIAMQMIAGDENPHTWKGRDGKMYWVPGFPSRPFIEDAIAENADLLEEKAEEFWLDVLYSTKNVVQSRDILGNSFIEMIKDYVYSDPYEPNGRQTVMDKGFNLPLVNTGKMIDSMYPRYTTK